MSYIFGAKSFAVNVSCSLQTRYSVCPQRDSNSHCTGFESVVSASWTTGAMFVSRGRFELPLCRPSTYCLCQLGYRDMNNKEHEFSTASARIRDLTRFTCSDLMLHPWVAKRQHFLSVFINTCRISTRHGFPFFIILSFLRHIKSLCDL